MPDTLSITEFRKAAGPRFSDAVHGHRPIPIERGSRDRGLLLGNDEVMLLVAGKDFSPEVFMGTGELVSIWLPEFELYGEGESFDVAKADLLDEVRAYIEEYVASIDEYLHAPNRVSHFPYLIKAWMADLDGELEQVLFAPPSEA